MVHERIAGDVVCCSQQSPHRFSQLLLCVPVASREGRLAGCTRTLALSTFPPSFPTPERLSPLHAVGKRTLALAEHIGAHVGDLEAKSILVEDREPRVVTAEIEPVKS